MFTLTALPFADSDLEPHISRRTIEFHYGKHHQAYVNNLNNLVAGSELESKTIEEIIKKTADQPEQAAIFNNAAQIWNHSFFWTCLSANGGQPDPDLLKLIETSFGSFEKFKEELKQAAVTQFGSGWAWVIVENNLLKIIKTANGDTPIAHGQKPVLTIDVWEHAYYLDYQNRRPDYVSAVINNLINWNFVKQQLSA